MYWWKASRHRKGVDVALFRLSLENERATEKSLNPAHCYLHSDDQSLHEVGRNVTER